MDAELAGQLVGSVISRRRRRRRGSGSGWILGVCGAGGKAEGDRRVSCRPAPDLMTYVTALVPVAWGVAVYAALVKHAAAAKAAGDPRSRGQLMADEFVSRITAPGRGVGVPGSRPARVRRTVRSLYRSRQRGSCRTRDACCPACRLLGDWMFCWCRVRRTLWRAGAVTQVGSR